MRATTPSPRRSSYSWRRISPGRRYPGPLHVDRELDAKRREARLADRGDGGARAHGLHAPAKGELLLADRRHLAALEVLEHEGVAQAHDLAVYPEDRVPVLVCDVEVLAV